MEKKKEKAKGGSKVAVAERAEKQVVKKPNEEYIPRNCDRYVTRKFFGMDDVEIIETAMDHRQNILLIGGTGVGKTHCLRFIAWKGQLPYMRVNLNGGTTVEDLIGQWVPATGGGFRWQDGVLTTFARHGGLFVVDEINAANAEILFVLHALLDDERKIVLVQKDGEVIHANDDFWFAATMNPSFYEGTKPLNRALFDRFHLKLDYGDSSPIEKKVSDEGFEWLIELRDKIAKQMASGEISGNVSPRGMLQYMENEKLYGEDVAKGILFQGFEGVSRSAVEHLVEVMFSGRPKKGRRSTESPVDDSFGFVAIQ